MSISPPTNLRLHGIDETAREKSRQDLSLRIDFDLSEARNLYDIKVNNKVIRDVKPGLFIKKLKENSLYEIFARARFATVESDWSEPLVTVTRPSPPSTLQRLKVDVIKNSITLSWNEKSNQEGWKVILLRQGEVGQQIELERDLPTIGRYNDISYPSGVKRYSTMIVVPRGLVPEDALGKGNQSFEGNIIEAIGPFSRLTVEENQEIYKSFRRNERANYRIMGIIR